MDSQSLIVGGALLIVGFFIGRMTAPRKDGHTIVYPPRSRDRDRTEQDADKDPAILSFIREGKMIDAIKRHRELTGSGLKEAKDAIDALAERIAR